ncbi:MAG: hypothetical protein ACK5CA_14120 [Cyanobacteriota bacterium]|jgi:hypothetical protein
MAPKNIKKQLQSLEINLVRKDVGFYEQLVGLLSKKQSSGIIIFGIMPYISLFTIESNKYIKSNLKHCTPSLPKNNEKIIQNSRMRLKLFDDDKNKVDGTFSLLDDISQFLENWFINSHQGPLASMKQALQPDMGIFFYEDHIIGSTHTWTYTNSLEKTEQLNSFEDTAGRMSQIGKSVGQDLGSYLAGIKKLRDFHSIPKNKLDYSIFKRDVNATDTKTRTGKELAGTLSMTHV